MSRPALATHHLLSSFRHDPALPKHTFYLLASVAFSVLNRPDEIPRIWRYALDNVAIRGSADEDYVRRELATGSGSGSGGGGGGGGEEGREESALVIHRKIREALLKSVVISGLPVAINALTALKNASPPHLLLAPTPTRRRRALGAPPAPLVARGNAFFSTVYGKVAARVMGGMTRSYDDLGVVAELLYAHVLSDTDVLGARDTSLLVVAGLVPQGVDPQLRGHLKGAVTNGATEEQVGAARRLAEVCCGLAGGRGGPPGARL